MNTITTGDWITTKTEPAKQIEVLDVTPEYIYCADADGNGKTIEPQDVESCGQRYLAGIHNKWGGR